MPLGDIPNRVHFLYHNHQFEGLANNLNSDRALPAGRGVVHTSGLGPLGEYEDVNGDVMPQSTHSAAHAQGNVVSFWLNSQTAPTHSPYKVGQWAYCWQNDIFPWAGNHSARLCADFQATLPHSTTTGGSVNYAYMAMAIRDCATQTVFWVQNSCYDSRGDQMRVEGLVWWAEMKNVIALGFYGGQRYCTPLPNSRHIQGKTWRDWRYFGASISAPQLLNMVCEANRRFNLQCSGNLDQYRLELIGVGPEMCVRDGQNGSMGMQIKDLRVFTWRRDMNVSKQ